MIDFEKLARQGFKLQNGRIYDKYSASVLFYDAEVYEFGWSSPCTEYHFTNYELSSYTIVKSVHYDEWYLKKNGYTDVCRLRHLGGRNWETYYT